MIVCHNIFKILKNERLVKAIRDCTLNSDHFQDEL